MMFTFDSGYLFGVSQAQGANPTPVKFASLLEVTPELNFALNPIKTQLQATHALLISALTLKFKAKTAQVNGLLLNQLFFGAALSTGSQGLANDVAVTVPGSPYKYTTIQGTFLQDLGVQYTSTGLALSPVASSPANGQYTVAAGVYTFAVADTGADLTINYLYTQRSGNSLALANGRQGTAPTFQAVLQGMYDGNQVVWNLNRCVSRSLVLAMVLSEMTISEFSFDAIGDTSSANGSIGTFSYSE